LKNKTLTVMIIVTYKEWHVVDVICKKI